MTLAIFTHPIAMTSMRRLSCALSCESNAHGWCKNTVIFSYSIPVGISVLIRTNATNTQVMSFFDDCATFCERWDQSSFDPNYDTLPLSFFAPLVKQVFARKPYDPVILQPGIPCRMRRLLPPEYRNRPMPGDLSQKIPTQRRRVWKYTPALPLRLAHYWNWPVRPIAAMGYLLRSWNPVALRSLMSLFAIVTWVFFTPDPGRAQSWRFDRV